MRVGHGVAPDEDAQPEEALPEEGAASEQPEAASTEQTLVSSKSSTAVQLTASALACMHVTPPLLQEEHGSPGAALTSHCLAFESSSDC